MAANKSKLSISNIRSSVLGAARGIRDKFTKPKVTVGRGGQVSTGGDISQPAIDLGHVSRQLAETNLILSDIGNALALDFANRVAEEKRSIANRKQALSRSKFAAKESALEGTKKVGSFITGSAKKLLNVTGLGGIFGGIWKFLRLILIGIAGTSLIKWIQGGGIGKLKESLSGIWEGIKNFVGPLFGKVKSGLSWIGEKLKPIWTPIWNVLKFAGTQMIRALRALAGFVINLKPLQSLGKAWKGTKRAAGGFADFITFDMWDFDNKNAPGSPKGGGLKRAAGGIADWLLLGLTDFDKRGSDRHYLQFNPIGGGKDKKWGNDSVTPAKVEPNIKPVNKDLVSSTPSIEFLHLPDITEKKPIEEPTNKITGIVPISSVNMMNEYMFKVPENLGITEV